MENQVGEAFASTAQDSSSLKSCPSLGRAALQGNSHTLTPSVLYTSQLRHYITVLALLVCKVSLTVPQDTCLFSYFHHAVNSTAVAREQLEKDMAYLSPSHDWSHRPLLPSHHVPGCSSCQHRDAGSQHQLHQGLLCQSHSTVVGTAGSCITCWNTENAVSAAGLMPHTCGSCVIVHNLPSLSA